MCGVWFEEIQHVKFPWCILFQHHLNSAESIYYIPWCREMKVEMIFFLLPLASLSTIFTWRVSCLPSHTTHNTNSWLFGDVCFVRCVRFNTINFISQNSSLGGLSFQPIVFNRFSAFSSKRACEGGAHTEEKGGIAQTLFIRAWQGFITAGEQIKIIKFFVP